MDESVRGLFERVRTYFRESREALNQATALEILKLVYFEIGRLPTSGETLTCLARLIARLNHLDRALREKIKEVSAQELTRFVREFWTNERASKLSAPSWGQLRMLLAHDAKTLTGVGQSFGMNSPLQKFTDFLLEHNAEGDQKLFREFTEGQRVFLQAESALNTLAALRPLVEQAALPSVIMNELLERLTPKPETTPNAYEPTVIIFEWQRGVITLIKDLKLEKEPLEVQVWMPEARIMTESVKSFDEAVKFIEEQARVTLEFSTPRILTGIEQRIRDQLIAFEKWVRNLPGLVSGEDRRVSSYLFMNDLLALRAPQHAEAVIRAFESLGIAPDRNAEAVLLRTGYQGYPAKYFLYPVPKRGYTLCVVLGHDYRDFDFVCAVRGSLDRAVQWVQSHQPIKFEENDEVVKAGPEVPRNALVFIASGEETIQTHLATRKEVAEFVAAGAATT